ncbi:hypothetical protein ACO2RV_08185 [Ancylobacter sp. VNQ12]|uniref:hypothetical protein n=1 Tax=Ancylobacter sp. VNQ12 TaxID=3400920 RepID=UPI003BFD6DF4
MKINMILGVSESNRQGIESLSEPAAEMESTCRQRRPSDSASKVFAGGFVLNRIVSS